MKNKFVICSLLIILSTLGAPFLYVSARSAYYPVLDAVNNASTFFSKWKVKKWAGKVDVAFKEEGDRNCVTLRSHKSSWAFLRDVKPDLKSTPFLTWHWRVDAYPAKADGRSKKTDDQAAQVYVVFPGTNSPLTFGMGRGWGHRIVGYTWETVTAKGTTYVSTKNSKTKIIVLRNSKDGAGRWVYEKRNVAEDFKKIFGTKAPNPVAVLFQIDSDDTGSSARSAFSQMGFSGQ